MASEQDAQAEARRESQQDHGLRPGVQARGAVSPACWAAVDWPARKASISFGAARNGCPTRAGSVTDRYDRAMGLWPQPRRELDMETGFGAVHVHHYGARNGKPIVLLHGRAGCSNG
ncbi:hypothetical protein [Kitasatospora cineracea]|uniref:hypothetical protein n=1 Tax=Kitasatospora cineracea TaxID=88074 RepID=UPI0033FFB140